MSGNKLLKKNGRTDCKELARLEGDYILMKIGMMTYLELADYFSKKYSLKIKPSSVRYAAFHMGVKPHDPPENDYVSISKFAKEIGLSTNIVRSRLSKHKSQEEGFSIEGLRFGPWLKKGSPNKPKYMVSMIYVQEFKNQIEKIKSKEAGLMTTSIAAKMLGLDAMSLCHLVRKGKIENIHISLSGRYMFEKSQVIEIGRKFYGHSKINFSNDNPIEGCISSSVLFRFIHMMTGFPPPVNREILMEFNVKKDGCVFNYLPKELAEIIAITCRMNTTHKLLSSVNTYKILKETNQLSAWYDSLDQLYTQSLLPTD